MIANHFDFQLSTVVVCTGQCVLLFASQLFMVGMKRDCGGAAGILGAFYTAVKLVSEVMALLEVCASRITCHCNTVSHLRFMHC